MAKKAIKRTRPGTAKKAVASKKAVKARKPPAAWHLPGSVKKRLTALRDRLRMTASYLGSARQRNLLLEPEDDAGDLRPIDGKEAWACVPQSLAEITQVVEAVAGELTAIIGVKP